LYFFLSSFTSPSQNHRSNFFSEPLIDKNTKKPGICYNDKLSKWTKHAFSINNSSFVQRIQLNNTFKTLYHRDKMDGIFIGIIERKHYDHRELSFVQACINCFINNKESFIFYIHSFPNLMTGTNIIKNKDMFHFRSK